MPAPTFPGWELLSHPGLPCYARRAGLLTSFVTPIGGDCWGFTLWIDGRDGSKCLEGRAGFHLDVFEAIALADATLADYAANPGRRPHAR